MFFDNFQNPIRNTHKKSILPNKQSKIYTKYLLRSKQNQTFIKKTIYPGSLSNLPGTLVPEPVAINQSHLLKPQPALWPSQFFFLRENRPISFEI
jgi:hypothetical protein